MSAVFAVDNYQDVQLPRSLACASFITRLQVKRKEPKKSLATAVGPKTSEMALAVAISIRAIANKDPIGDTQIDWV